MNNNNNNNYNYITIIIINKCIHIDNSNKKNSKKTNVHVELRNTKEMCLQLMIETGKIVTSLNIKFVCQLLNCYHFDLTQLQLSSVCAGVHI